MRKAHRPRLSCTRPAPRARSAAFDDAQSYFQDAIALAPTDARLNTEWGELFREKYNNDDAAKSFQDALKADAEYDAGAARHGQRADATKIRRRRMVSSRSTR